MKVVMVAGFFEPVRREIELRFEDQLHSRSIVWIRQIGRDAGPDLKRFRRDFRDRLAAGAVEVLVLLAVLRTERHLDIIYSVDGIISGGRLTWPDARVHLETVRNAGAASYVVQRISEFGLATGELALVLGLDLCQTGKKFLETLPPKQASQIETRIRALCRDPRPPDSKRLKQTVYRRADIGEYRIIYRVLNDVLEVVRIGKRNDGEVYRRLAQLR